MKSTTKPLWRVSVATSPDAEDAVAEMLGGLLDTAAALVLNLAFWSLRAQRRRHAPNA